MFKCCLLLQSKHKGCAILLSMDTARLVEEAKEVLDANKHGEYTIPASGLYPHQWLWDSCFIAIGLRHIDVDRAKTEILSLLRGQWSNGMLPNMIFVKGLEYAQDRNIWRSWVSPFSPDDVATSGITQPPMLAEAIVSIGNKLNKTERRTWYQTIYPALVAYHSWLYNERDPHGEGLVVQIHPYECGLDNTPPWINQLHQHSRPWWANVLEFTRLDRAVNIFRRDTRHVPPGQRMSNIDALLYFSVIRRLRRKLYNSEAILRQSEFAVEDLTFNCIFIRANQHLRDIAKTIKRDIPEDLDLRMKQSETALERLWDAYSNQFYSRNFMTHKLIKEPSIATLMPLYASCANQDQLKQIVKLLENKDQYGPHFPVPSVSVDSTWFKPTSYWQGPTWLNTNWLIIDGLKRSGYPDHAAALTESTLDLVDQSGFAEYFSPLTGEAAGAHNFSWTAALTIDLATPNKKPKTNI